MKYFGGCDVGSTFTKAIILDENGNIVPQGKPFYSGNITYNTNFILPSNLKAINNLSTEDNVGYKNAIKDVLTKDSEFYPTAAPDYTDEEVEEEYKRIMEERSAAMPMYLSVEDEDTDEDEE